MKNMIEEYKEKINLLQQEMQGENIDWMIWYLISEWAALYK